jgi:two-component system response regulator HydG
MEDRGQLLSEHNITGESVAVRDIVNLIDQVAQSDCPVLIEGESGTGKELVARRLHTRGPRKAQPFIPVNCAGVGEGVFESQFFGHIKGAFTGAEQSMLGLVRAADKGTLFLDEVGEISPRMQAKLLRVLQDGEVLPVGTTRPEKVNTRFIAATNRDLRQEVEEGRFRKDLFYRLNIVRIHIPPLRERPEDIQPLLKYFLSRLGERYHRPAISIKEHLYRALEQYPWPGNVRELASWVERLYVTGQGQDRLAEELIASEAPMPAEAGELLPNRVMAIEEAERWAISQAMRHSGSNLTLAATLLRIHRTTLWRKLRKYDIS